ncbi:hypothetical protein M513_13653 [Trichuris suis]|uniref:Uncharacterized protein n=1 Tax=Trichuris suis TaxID=68888 RepID=A0A085LKH4_9BILA|nr:hypothetical protein M513_13653 [Trichuris suis]
MYLVGWSKHTLLEWFFAFPSDFGHIAFFGPVAVIIPSAEVRFSADRWFRWAFPRFVHVLTYGIVLCGTILRLVLIGSRTLFHTCRTIIWNLGDAALPAGLTVIDSLPEQRCTNGTHWIRRSFSRVGVSCG